MASSIPAERLIALRGLVETVGLSKIDNKFKCSKCSGFLFGARELVCCHGEAICDDCYQAISDACPLCDNPVEEKNKAFPADTDKRLDVNKYLNQLQKDEDELRAPLPFILPEFYIKGVSLNGLQSFDRLKRANHFSSRSIAYAMQRKVPPDAIRSYIATLDSDMVKRELSKPVACRGLKFDVPVLFFAVASGSAENIRILHAAGASLEARTTEFNIGVLPYTVLSYALNRTDTTELFRTLIGLGANPEQIQKSMWESYLEPKPQAVTNPTTIRDRCQDQIQNAISTGLNLTQRYLLNMADAYGAVPRTKKDYADMLNYSQLLEVPYSIVGQRYAISQLIKYFTGNFIVRRNSRKPIVVALTGASGHGKTELAKKMGALLECPFHTVNCPEMTTEMELFGPKPPYQGSDISRPLNKFLCDNEDQRCIVFLDEFEKSTDAVRNSLLLLLGDGQYTDRVTSRKLTPCLKTIWIIAANVSVNTISKFYHEHKYLGKEFLDKAPLRALQITLRKEFMAKMGAPITGRIGKILPYLPFSEGEAAVVAHGFFLQHLRDFRSPFSKGNAKLVGDLDLDFTHEGEAFKFIASQFYLEESGSRSLDDAVFDEVINEVTEYVQKPDVPLQRDPDAFKSLKRVAISSGMDEISKVRKIILVDGGRVELPASTSRLREPLFTTEEWEMIDKVSGRTGVKELCTK